MTKNKNFTLKKIKKSPRRMWLWTLLIIIAVLILGLGAYLAFGQNKDQTSSQIPGSDTVNLEPPSESEKQAADENKDRLTETDNSTSPNETPPPPSNPSQKKSVTPTITEASRNSVKAYVLGIFEEDGTCTATFNKDGQTLTKTSVGFQNASYTQCAPIELDNGFLSSGKWSVTVKYSSVSSEGTSDVQYIE